MRDRDRVDVDVDHPGVGAAALGDLVHVADGRDAGADVEELPRRPARSGTAPPGAGTPGWPAPISGMSGHSREHRLAASSRSTAKLCDPPR